MAKPTKQPITYVQFGAPATSANVNLPTQGAETNIDDILYYLNHDGAGSTMDADLLDGKQGAWYADVVNRLGYRPVDKAGDTMNGVLSGPNAVNSGDYVNLGQLQTLLKNAALLISMSRFPHSYPDTYIGGYVAAQTWTLKADGVGCYATITQNVPSTQTLDIMKLPVNTKTLTKVGTITFTQGTSDGVFSTSGQDIPFSTGDGIFVYTPDTNNGTLTDIAVTIYGETQFLLNQSDAIISFGNSYKLQASSSIGQYVASSLYTIPANFTGSYAVALTPPTGQQTFNVMKMTAGTTNITQIGTITFAAGASTGTFTTVNSTSQSINAGDTLYINVPASADSTIADISITIVGNAG